MDLSAHTLTLDQLGGPQDFIQEQPSTSSLRTWSDLATGRLSFAAYFDRLVNVDNLTCLTIDTTGACDLTCKGMCFYHPSIRITDREVPLDSLTRAIEDAVRTLGMRTLAIAGKESVTAEDYQRFLTAQRNTMVRNLRTIPDQRTAEELIHKCRANLVKLLKFWNDASDAADHADLELAEATDRNRNATRGDQESERAAEETRSSLLRAERSLSDAQVAAQQLLKPFLEVAEECVTAPGTETEPLLETLERSRRTLRISAAPLILYLLRARNSKRCG